jgi:hypothetical protein
MRPRRGPWGALAAPVDDADGAGVSWRVTSAWARDYADNATTSSATLCFPKPYLLALALCTSVGPPIWVVSVDPMVEELAASLVMSRPTRAPVPGCLPTQAVAP